MGINFHKWRYILKLLSRKSFANWRSSVFYREKIFARGKQNSEDSIISEIFFFFPFRVELNASSILLQKTKVHNKARKRVDLWDKSQQTECRNYENGVISNGDVRNKTFLEGKIFRDLKFFCSFPEKIFHNFLAQNIFRQKLLFF